MKLFWFWAVIGLVLSDSVHGFELLDFNVTEGSYLENSGIVPQADNALMVGLTLIQSADAKGAGTMDSSVLLPSFSFVICYCGLMSLQMFG